MSASDPELPLFRSGPLWRLARRRRLLRGDDGWDVLRASVVLVLLCWAPSPVLAGVEAALGHGVDPAMLQPKTHVRWLVAAPLLIGFVAVLERFVDEVVRWLRSTELIRPGATTLDDVVRSTAARLRHDALDVVLVALALIASLPEAARAGTVAGAWTALIGGGGFRALGLVVLSRWLHWVRVVVGLVRIGLDPSPLHPDGAGGLGVFAIPSRGFGLVAAAFGSVASATFVAQVTTRGAGLPELGQIAGLYTVVVLLLGLGPTFLLVPTLLRVRLRAQLVHGGFAERYVRAFQVRWLDPADPGDPLGSADIQSLADVQGSMRRALDSGVLPFRRDTVLVLVVCALTPFVPCLLLIVPVAQVARWLANALA